MTRFEIEEVRDLHRGESACILGNGPSLKRWTKRLPSLREHHLLLGMNKSWTEVESPYHFAICGEHWKDFARGRVPGVRRMFTIDSFLHPGRPRPEGSVRSVPTCFIRKKTMSPKEEFDFDLESGTWAKFVPWLVLQCGLYMGIDTFWLLGIDEHADEGHHHDDVGGSRSHHLRWWGKVAYWLRRNPGVRIINANQESAVRVFPFGEPPGGNE